VRPARLDVLLHAYVAERADDTQTVTSMFGLLTAAVSLISLIGFALINHASVPAWLLALAPLAPIPFIAFGALLAHIGQIRGRVIDGYERELRAIANRLDGGRSRIPYGHSILDRVVWDAWYSRLVILISFLAFFGLYIAVLIECFRYAKGTEFGLAVTGLACSSIATLALIGLYVAALFPYYWLRRGLRGLAPKSELMR
jgi:hypothetical protein